MHCAAVCTLEQTISGCVLQKAIKKYKINYRGINEHGVQGRKRKINKNI